VSQVVSSHVAAHKVHKCTDQRELRLNFFSVTQQATWGLGRLFVEFPKSRTIRQTRPAGLLRKGDQIVAEVATYTTVIILATAIVVVFGCVL